MAADPLLDTKLPPPDELPQESLWRNSAFRRLAQLLATLGAGALALVIGLRATAFLATLGGLVAAAFIWFSPVRRLKTIEPVG